MLFGALNTTVALATHVVPAPPTIAKSPALLPLNATVAIVSGAVPVLLSVTVCCPLVTLTNWLLKFSVVATDATGAIPVPFRVTV